MSKCPHCFHDMITSGCVNPHCSGKADYSLMNHLKIRLAAAESELSELRPCLGQLDKTRERLKEATELVTEACYLFEDIELGLYTVGPLTSQPYRRFLGK